ncbi:MAG: ATP-grasp domain-containing protein [Burkholderiales bacterium]
MSGEAILIAAVSGRALAQSASRGRFDPVVLDLFNDRDLRAAAAANVCAKGGLRFNERELCSVASTLAAGLPLVYGAGFEACPQTLSNLARGRKLYGNSPETLARVNDPERFFTLLDDLRIPHPEVSLTLPSSPEGWLAKKAGGAGGWHIGEKIRAKKGCYFQRRVSGRALSVLFLADGRNTRVIGFNETRTAKLSGKPFCYAGAISHALVPPTAQAGISITVERLVESLALIGLNGMDFMLEGEEVSILEINARPPATLELYDADFAQGILAAHIRACEGSLPTQFSSDAVRASTVVYAHSPARITRSVRWPDHASDIPRVGTVIGTGQPICTVHAEGSDFARVEREVRMRADTLHAILFEKAA